MFRVINLFAVVILALGLMNACSTTTDPAEAYKNETGEQIFQHGEEALRVVNNKLPDIILLDMMLPKISGPNVLKALKENPATMNIPVIVFTSLSQKNEEKLISEGAAAYFEKSALALDQNSSRLADTVETVLAKAMKRRASLPGQTRV